MTLRGSDLLLALAERMTQEARELADVHEAAKALTMADIFQVAGREIRDGRAGELHLAVLAQANLGRHLVADDDD